MLKLSANIYINPNFIPVQLQRVAGGFVLNYIFLDGEKALTVTTNDFSPEEVEEAFQALLACTDSP